MLDPDDCPRDEENEYFCYDYDGDRVESCEGHYHYVSQPGSEEFDIFAAEFEDAGLIYGASSQCSYHCSCRRCTYTRDAPFLAFQEDGSVGIEFITKVCDADNGDDLENIDRMIETFAQAMEYSGWQPSGDQGNHVHVNATGVDPRSRAASTFRPETSNRAHQLVGALLSIGTWDMVAAGGRSRLRSYNSKSQKGWDVAETAPAIGSYIPSGWVANKGMTTEYRLWNTPRIAERIKAHIGLSIGIQRWAFGQLFAFDELRTMSVGEFENIANEKMGDIHEVILDATPKFFRDQASEALGLWTPA